MFGSLGVIATLALSAPPDGPSDLGKAIAALQLQVAALREVEKYRAPPLGTVAAFAGPATAVPDGWCLCDGSALDTAAHPEFAPLQSAIGNSWGGSGTTFRLPDLRGRFVRGVDSGSGRDPDAASRGVSRPDLPPEQQGAKGDQVGSFQVGATRRPTTPFVTDKPGDHTHRLEIEIHAGRQDGRVGNTAANPDVVHGQYLGTEKSGDHDHRIISGGDAETRPDNAAVNWIIRCKEPRKARDQ